MTLTLTAAAWDDLWNQSWEQSYSPAHEPFVEICPAPAAIGNGTFESIELYPEVWLGIGRRTYPGETILFLQGKVHDLIGLQLMSVLRDRGSFPIPTRLKPETIARLHHAKDLLAMQLEQPPSLSTLAQQVGVSDRTLQRGFQTLFKTTVMGYLIEQRLKQAEQLLRQGATEGLRSTRTVTAVATMVGYGNMGHFAMAFKRRFGITPSQCLAGKMADFE